MPRGKTGTAVVHYKASKQGTFGDKVVWLMQPDRIKRTDKDGNTTVFDRPAGDKATTADEKATVLFCRSKEALKVTEPDADPDEYGGVWIPLIATHSLCVFFDSEARRATLDVLSQNAQRAAASRDSVKAYREKATIAEVTLDDLVDLDD